MWIHAQHARSKRNDSSRANTRNTRRKRHTHRSTINAKMGATQRQTCNNPQPCSTPAHWTQLRQHVIKTTTCTSSLPTQHTPIRQTELSVRHLNRCFSFRCRHGNIADIFNVPYDFDMRLLVSKTRALGHIALHSLCFCSVWPAVIFGHSMWDAGPCHVGTIWWNDVFWSPPQLAIALSEAQRVEARAPVQNMFFFFNICVAICRFCFGWWLSFQRSSKNAERMIHEPPTEPGGLDYC